MKNLRSGLQVTIILLGAATFGWTFGRAYVRMSHALSPSPECSCPHRAAPRIVMPPPQHVAPPPSLLSMPMPASPCVVDHEALFGRTSTLVTSARIVPSFVDGKPRGFKLYAIRPTSLFAELGLRNGDTLLRVNGVDMTKPEGALDTYAKLRPATRIQLQVERRGFIVDLPDCAIR